MTAIKQVSVHSARHLKNVESYLDWHRDKALAHDTFNIIDEDRAFIEMDETRRSAGHDVPGKANSRWTPIEHQVVAFNADECSCNGGKMTPELCMKYAREYVRTRYEDYESVLVLHLEHCASDNTDRYCCHIAINRSNILSGLRLDEGPARQAAKARVATIRSLDQKYGLKQLERGKANSRVHGRQPGTAERDMARKGQAERSENERVRRTVAKRIEEVGRMPDCPDRMAELSRRLARDGIKLKRSKGGDLQYRFHSKSLGGERRVNGARLGYVTHRRTGRTIRFTYHGVLRAIRLCMQLYRTMDYLSRNY